MSQMVETPTRALTAGGTITQWALVKVGAALTCTIAAITEEAIGVAEHAAVSGGLVRVRLLSAQGTIKCAAAGAFSVGAVVYGQASGLVDDASGSSQIRIGIALEAATAANDIVEVLPSH